jgi:hypothetical protein
MTLKEKFEMTMISFLIEKKQDATMLDHFQKIADDYATEFAEWVLNRALGESGLELKDDTLDKFKKEKGL